jgi:hydroxymethylpyrimidine pyrophosphatase-like HAD family hydrolase
VAGYKLIALDVDGTLLDPTGTIRPRVRAAVQQAVSAGAIVTLATGRRHRPARKIAADLGIAAVPLILYSGSIIYDPQTESALLHRPLPADFVRNALALLRQAGINGGVLQSPLRGERIFLGPLEHDDPYIRDYATDPLRADLVERRSHEALAAVEDPLVVVAAGPEHVARKLEKLIRENESLGCTLYGYRLRHTRVPELYGYDLLPLGHTKAIALEWLARHYGLDLSQVMVIGDGLNDLEMLRVAGLGVAMGNAAPELKAIAGAIVATNQDDGVAEAIERFVLD